MPVGCRPTPMLPVTVNRGEVHYGNGASGRGASRIIDDDRGAVRVSLEVLRVSNPSAFVGDVGGGAIRRDHDAVRDVTDADLWTLGRLSARSGRSWSAYRCCPARRKRSCHPARSRCPSDRKSWAPSETSETVWPQGISMLPVVPGGLPEGGVAAGLYGKQVTVVR